MKLRLLQLISQLYRLYKILILLIDIVDFKLNIDDQNVQSIVSPTKILKEISPVPFITKSNTLKRWNDLLI